MISLFLHSIFQLQILSWETHRPPLSSTQLLCFRRIGYHMYQFALSSTSLHTLDLSHQLHFGFRMWLVTWQHHFWMTELEEVVIMEGVLIGMDFHLQVYLCFLLLYLISLVEASLHSSLLLIGLFPFVPFQKVFHLPTRKVFSWVLQVLWLTLHWFFFLGKGLRSCLLLPIETSSTLS